MRVVRVFGLLAQRACQAQQYPSINALVQKLDKLKEICFGNDVVGGQAFGPYIC
jgi:hypothetical protein